MSEELHSLRGLTPTQSEKLEIVIAKWDPRERPIHCSNCFHAKITLPVSDPQAFCAKGHGKSTMDVWPLFRMQQPRGFRPAEDCEDFSSMDEETPG